VADVTLEPGWALPKVRLQVVEWVMAHREVVALASIMAVAAVLRFWDLDAKALHHDESLHAIYTWYLYEGRGYTHDPLMHGPFLFQAGALVFMLFGDTDYSTRILPALFGTVLVGMPYLLRKQIGMKAVLIAAVLLTISPTILYVSRFDRHDIYISVWMLAMTICIWRYLDERRPGYLYALAAVLALSFGTMEVTFIHAAILLVFLDLMLAVELGRRRDDEAVSDLTVAARSLSLAPIAWLIAALWPLLGRRPLERDRLPAVGDVLVVVGTLSLPMFSAGIQFMPFFDDKGYNVAAEDTLRVVTVLALILASAYVGLLWRPKVWLICAACFFIPFVLLYTTFLTNQPPPWSEAFWRGHGGFYSGIWGSLDYWLAQHDVQRGDQPRYYYFLLTPLYEFLPLLIALVAGIWAALRGNSLTRWFLFWLIGIVVGLSVAGEKMPWLEVHIALPLTLVAAVGLARAIEGLDFNGRWLSASGSAAVAGAGVLLILEGESQTLRLAGLVLLAVLFGWTVAALAGGRQALARAGLAVVLGALLVLAVRAALTASFRNADTPVEMLVYTQTAPDIPAVRDQIDALAAETGLGHNLPITIDPTDGYAWPWVWYLRDYHDLRYASPDRPGYQPPVRGVMLIHRANAAYVTGDGYNQQLYKHRWWFNEDYKNLEDARCEEKGRSLWRRSVCALTLHLNLGEFVRTFSAGSLIDDAEGLGRFFLYRRPIEGNTGSVDGVAYFPTSPGAIGGEGSVRAPAEPVVQPDGRIIFGRVGSGPGELAQPADLFVDLQGNIWVADGRNNRIEKFSSDGRHLASVGGVGSTVSFNEPWSLTVDGEGFVYVADTWNHRIVKLSPQLQVINAWGQPATRPNPGPFELFGPRDIVIALDGTLWVTDTGNKRLINYSRDGAALGVYGREGSAPGEFREPVGLVADRDGRFYVADTWNGRIQRFGAGFTAPVSFDVGWTSQDILAKPYMAVLDDGRIVAAEPGRSQLVLLSATGSRIGVWQPGAEAMPVGVAALPDGGFAFSDIRRNQVEVVPAGLIETLFR
jgi:uncharacterized protein (TIGR03663 family)